MEKKINRLSVVVPAYNEEDCIQKTIERVETFLRSKPFDFEIIVVDDGSADKTAEIVENLCGGNERIRLIRNETNKGKGFAVKKGILSACGDYTLFMDADFSTPIEEFDKFQRNLENGSLVVIGSRREKESDIKVPQSWYRVLMGQGFTLLSRFLVAPTIHDFTCGFKCFESSIAKEIFGKQRLNDWSFDAEILHIAYKKEIKITQVPVCWENRPNSKVRIISSVIRSLWGLLRIMINSSLGKY